MKTKEIKKRSSSPIFQETKAKLDKVASELHLKFGKKMNRMEVIDYLADNFKK